MDVERGDYEITQITRRITVTAKTELKTAVIRIQQVEQGCRSIVHQFVTLDTKGGDREKVLQRKPGKKFSLHSEKYNPSKTQH